MATMSPDSEEPPASNEKVDWVCLAGPMSLALSVCLQLVVAALLIIGPFGTLSSPDDLTEYAKRNLRPELDIPIYLSGIALTLAVMTTVAVRWRKRFEAAKRMGSAGRTCALLAGISLALFVSLASSGSYPGTEGSFEPLDFRALLRLLLPAIGALVCAAWCFRAEAPRLEVRMGRWRGGAPAKEWAVFCFMCAVIVMFVGVPPVEWARVAGTIYAVDEFHHTNFFAMGPALSFAHRRAFATEIFSQYGIGWPLIVSQWNAAARMTYANFIGMETSYACIYYIALFLLLRAILQRPVWAGVGTLLAVYLQIFSGLNPGEVIWVYPSSTMMRHPMDVWFFLALMAYLRKGGFQWAALSGGIAGAAVFFETDTGVMLLPVFAFCWILRLDRKLTAIALKGQCAALLAFIAAGCAVLLPLLGHASRGTLFRRAFWSGWVEALTQYGGGGMGSIPFTELPPTALSFFAVIMLTYLAVIGCVLARWLYGALRRDDALLAGISAYGLAVLLVFVSRTHAYNLCHATVPFVIVLIVLLARAEAAFGWMRRAAFPHVALCGMLFEIVAQPAFRDYPNWFKAVPAPGENLSLIDNPADVSGLPHQFLAKVQQFRAVSAGIRNISAEGHSVAILDADDANLYHAADTVPWTRYASLFYTILTTRDLDAVRSRLLDNPPDYVVTMGKPADQPKEFEAVWRTLYQTVRERYTIEKTVESYEFWRSRDR